MGLWLLNYDVVLNIELVVHVDDVDLDTLAPSLVRLVLIRVLLL